MLSSNESPEEVEEAGNVAGAAITLTAPASFAFLCTVTVSWIVRTIGSRPPGPPLGGFGSREADGQGRRAGQQGRYEPRCHRHRRALLHLAPPDDLVLSPYGGASEPGCSAGLRAG